MTRKIYPHRPCVSIAVCLGLGIWLGTVIKLSWPIGLIIGGLLCMISFATRHLKWGSWTVHALFMVVGMMCVANIQLLPPTHVAHLTYHQRASLIMMEGTVVSESDIRQTARGEKTVFELEIKRVQIADAWYDRQGKVMVNIFRKEELVEYGDRIRLNGKLHKPFEVPSRGHFSYENYLKRNGIYWVLSVKKSAPVDIVARRQGSVIYGSLLKYRQRLKQVLEHHLSAFEAGIVQSLVLGGRYSIPERTRELFVQTGTAHILAISGMNVAGMAFIIFLILNVLRVPRRPQIFLTSLVLIAYCLLTGANPSVIRATIMAVVMLWGLLFEEQTDTLNSLGFSAIVILLLDPQSLFDIGFQLSFAGVFSIIYLYPKIYGLVGRWAKDKMTTMLMQALCVSLAAWIGVLPLIAYYFQIVTPSSILANIPIIPFVSALFMLGFGLIVTGLLCPSWAFLFAHCIKCVLFMLMVIVDVFSKIPGGYVYVPNIRIHVIVLYYAAMAILCFYLDRRIKTSVADQNLHFLS